MLFEALIESAGSTPVVKERTLEASRTFGFLRWSQYLKFIEVGSATYFHEGNGRVESR